MNQKQVAAQNDTIILHVSGQHHTLTTLPPGKRPCTRHTEGWVGLGAGMNGYGIPCHQQDSILGLFSLQQIIILICYSGRPSTSFDRNVLRLSL
jgi:hypothetical protein